MIKRQAIPALLVAVLGTVVLPLGAVDASEVHSAVVKANPANFTPNVEPDGVVAKPAVHALKQLGGTMYAGVQSAEPVRGIAQAQIPLAFVDRLITLRNHRMRDRALSLLRQGGAFLAVGAVHLPGKEGLLSLFEMEGYHVDALE